MDYDGQIARNRAVNWKIRYRESDDKLTNVAHKSHGNIMH